MSILVKQEEYNRAELWYSEQFNKLPYEDRLRLGVDERIIRVQSYEFVIRDLQATIAKLKRQQDIWKKSLIEDWKKNNFDKS